MDVEPEGGWHRPPPEGRFAEDLDTLPGLPRDAELIDGSIVVPSPRALFHMKALRLVENAFVRHAPRDSFLVRRDMSVVLSRKQRPRPDLLVVHASAEIDDDATCYPADAVVLALEVTSRGSLTLDQEWKPHLYAAAGIPFHWRVEHSARRKPVVHAFEWDPATRAYGPLGIFHDRLVLTVPFPIDIDLTEIDRM
ncbi:Uma2 family endonuclease [Actinoplanes flavus]|uniref:Uma2 family endonuclease n=1 Tax=Actinoplanes flavus TaxID=2820290 RepID=A0ABS3UGI0_9ACTN|nr:Uma2 family endonuclease [Actinoplanes flavus]MBO3737879.1 Uma2 family endonuclease [Actinoplanes flavus]